MLPLFLDCPIQDGRNPIWWASELFRTCLYDYTQAFGNLFGILSICCWVTALMPQIYQNWRRKSTDGLSFYFVIQWMLGDSFSFAGMVLSRQLWYQIALSSYFILIDFFVLCQWVYYDYLGLSSLRSRSLKGHSALADPYAPAQSPPPPPLLSTETPYATPTEATHLLVAAQPATLSASSLSTPNGAINSSNYRPSSPPTDLTLMRRRCLNVCACIALVFIVVTPCVLVYKHNPDISRFLDSNSERIGQVFGWTCNCFYWSSRLPQAYKNYRRKSVVGLSVFTFITIFTGNITSSISIALQYPTAPDDYIRKSRPFIIGPIGSIAIDVFFITQVLYYTHLDRKRQTLQQQQLERQEQEQQQSLSKHSANHQLTISVHSVGLE